ncbi:hypothetical protein HDU88_006331 [Geranomyces variabilis]|nr:hypothetical protein HDU88_006331 [Geranomyces variabilis]
MPAFANNYDARAIALSTKALRTTGSSSSLAKSASADKKAKSETVVASSAGSISSGTGLRAPNLWDALGPMPNGHRMI